MPKLKKAATDLECVNCVDTNEILNNTIGPDDLDPQIRSFLQGFPGSADTPAGNLSGSCPTGKFVGEVWLFAGNFEPEGTAFAHGQILLINTNFPLFAILGTMYGGDGETDFGLPDLQGLEPAGMNYVICLVGEFPLSNDSPS